MPAIAADIKTVMLEDFNQKKKKKKKKMEYACKPFRKAAERNVNLTDRGGRVVSSLSFQVHQLVRNNRS